MNRHEFIYFAKRFNLEVNKQCMKRGSTGSFYVNNNISETHLTIGFHDVVCTKSLIIHKDYIGGISKAIKLLEEMYIDCIEGYKRFNNGNIFYGLKADFSIIDENAFI